MFHLNFREDEQVIGAYFIINQVGTQDYGQYVCTVTNADSDIEIPIRLHHKGLFFYQLTYNCIIKLSADVF